MNRDEALPEYHAFDQFSPGNEVVTAADANRLVVGVPDGRIWVITAGDIEKLAVDDQLDDVAVDQSIFTLSSGTVGAYTTGGVNLWTAAVEGATAIAGPGQGTVACVTDDGRLVGLDGDTGIQMFDVERPHGDISEGSAVGGGHDYVAVATWSFLTLYDTAGNVLVDTNLDGAIQSHAVASGAVVARLKDGRLVSVDADTGEVTWSSSVVSDVVTSYGDGALAVVDGSVERFDRHGTNETVDIDAGEPVVSALSGGVVAVNTDGTYRVYRRGEPPKPELSATILTDTVRRRDGIRVRIENRGGTSAETSIQLDVPKGAPVAFASTSETLALDPEERGEVAFRISDVTANAAVEIRVSTEDERLATSWVTVEPPEDLIGAVTASASVERVEDDRVTVSVSLDNHGAVEELTASISDGDQIDLPPGPESTLTTTVDYNGDATVTVPVDLSVGGRVETLETEVDVPAATPVVGVEPHVDSRRPFLDVTVENATFDEMSDSLTVTAADTPLTIERDVTLPVDGTFRLAVPITSAIVERGLDVEATLTDTGVTTATSIPADAWERGTGDRRRKPSLSSSGEGVSADDAPVTNESASESVADGSLDIDRAVPDSVQRGQTFDEQIVLTVGSGEGFGTITVELGEVKRTFQDANPGERIVLARKRAVFQGDSYRLPTGIVTFDGESRPIPATTIPVAESSFTAYVTVDRAEVEQTVRFDCVNHTDDRRLRIEGAAVDVGPQGEGRWDLEPTVTISPGESRTFERTLPTDDVDAVPSVRQALVRMAFEDGELKDHYTLADVQNGTERVTNDISGSAESVDVDTSSADVIELDVNTNSVVVAGRSSSVGLTLRNVSDLPVRSVTLSPEGDVVSQNPLSRGAFEIDSLAGDQTRSHHVDVEPGSGDGASFTVQLTGEANGETFEREYVVRGPVASSLSSWEEDELVEEWRVEPVSPSSSNQASDSVQAGETTPGSDSVPNDRRPRDVQRLDQLLTPLRVVKPESRR